MQIHTYIYTLVDLNDLNDQNENDFGNSFFCKLLPIQIDCERGAFITGNPKTPSLLVADFSQSSGIYDAVKVYIIYYI